MALQRMIDIVDDARKVHPLSLRCGHGGGECRRARRPVTTVSMTLTGMIQRRQVRLAVTTSSLSMPFLFETIECTPVWRPTIGDPRHSESGQVRGREVAVWQWPDELVTAGSCAGGLPWLGSRSR